MVLYGGTATGYGGWRADDLDENVQESRGGSWHASTKMPCVSIKYHRWRRPGGVTEKEAEVLHSVGLAKRAYAVRVGGVGSIGNCEFLGVSVPFEMCAKGNDDAPLPPFDLLTFGASDDCHCDAVN